MSEKSQQARIISQNIKRLRDEKGWNQSTLAAKAGITPAALSQIEKGDKRLPTFVVLRKLASALNVEPFELAGDAPPPSGIEQKSREFYRRWDILEDLSDDDQKMLRGMAERLKEMTDK
ncbi:MAG: helix-turn-helix transcriptional regulator [Pseudomonadota bacterium]|nr:XRE family transcriptional regulator [Pseudomonadota bacterium]QKK05109.1 MAG: helix-turn-helix transcriptional regulator [Pseudomonadota bacterium]